VTLGIKSLDLGAKQLSGMSFFPHLTLLFSFAIFFLQDQEDFIFLS
jgi:hypothetical protein